MLNDKIGIIPLIAMLVIMVMCFKILLEETEKDETTNSDKKENFMGGGALIQLHAKGNQDLYLTPENWLWEQSFFENWGRWYPPREFIWNNSTRVSRDYPYYIPMSGYIREYPILRKSQYRYLPYGSTTYNNLYDGYVTTL
jgi:hypothetical protein